MRMVRQGRVKLQFMIVLISFTWVSVRTGLKSTAFAADTTSNSVPGFGSPWPYLFNLFFALTIVIVLAILLIRFLAKRANIQQKGAISVLAARQLAPNRSVQVVEVQGKKYLLGIAENITLIAEVTDTFQIGSDTHEDKANESSPFRQLLLDKLANVRESYRARGTGEDSK